MKSSLQILAEQEALTLIEKNTKLFQGHVGWANKSNTAPENQ